MSGVNVTLPFPDPSPPPPPPQSFAPRRCFHKWAQAAHLPRLRLAWVQVHCWPSRIPTQYLAAGSMLGYRVDGLERACPDCGCCTLEGGSWCTPLTEQIY